MPRLKSRNQWPPISFRFLQAETGWDSTKTVGLKSLDVVSHALMEHRKGNKYLAEKHGWNLDHGQIINEVDEFTAALNIQAGYYDFVEMAAPPKAKPPSSQLPGNVAAAAGANRIVGGLKAFLEMFGEEGAPVAPEESQRRADVCVRCPKNDRDLNWIEKFEKGAANLLKMQLAIRHDMKLETTHDRDLGLCTACGCPMALKVHAPMELILKRTTLEIKAKLDEICWIR